MSIPALIVLAVIVFIARGMVLLLIDFSRRLKNNKKHIANSDLGIDWIRTIIRDSIPVGTILQVTTRDCIYGNIILGTIVNATISGSNSTIELRFNCGRIVVLQAAQIVYICKISGPLLVCVGDREKYTVVLGLDVIFTKEELKTAYHGLFKKHHPDLWQHASDNVRKEHEEVSKSVSEAYAFCKKLV